MDRDMRPWRERNIYKDEIDFKQLARQDPDFAKVLEWNGQLDFSDPVAVQQLTKSLLKRDFKLILELPPDRLCPPVPNRLNYILWMQDLVDDGALVRCRGLDIGTGASCIYPLLGCMSRRRWKFFATDIDDHSLQYAERNIEANGLEDRITLHRSTAEGPLFPLDALHLHGLDFVMCNPPFYESTEELVTCATGKSRPPYTACTGSVTEMVTPGGEVAFVSRMIKESQVLQGRVSWYSSMLGKLSSVIAILEKLKGEGITNFAVAEFIQGTRTRRWAVAWSFLELKPRMDVARAVKGSGVPKHLLPYPSEYAIPVPSLDRATVGKRIDTIFDHLPLDDWDWSSPYGFGEAHGNVWSRSARRRMTRKRKICELIEQDMAKKVKLEPVDSKQEAEMSREMGALHKQGEEEEKELEVKSETEASDSSLHFYISVKDLHDMESTEMGALVVVWWVAGVDSAIFESLCGWLKRKLESQEDDLPPARPTGESSPSQMKLESPVKKIKEDVKLEDAEDDSTASVAQAGPIQHNVKDEADLTAIKPESL